MDRAFAIAVSLLALLPVGCLDDGSSDGGSSAGVVKSGGTGSGAGDGTEGPSVTYAQNGHPLNWLTDNQAVIDLEDDVHDIVNNHRVSLGLGALIHVIEIRRAARGHSNHMRGASHDFFEHVNPEGDEPWDRMTKNSIPWTVAGENIAVGYTTPQSVFDGWMASPGHKENIERSVFTRTGIGYQSGAPRGTYWTQLFAD